MAAALLGVLAGAPLGIAQARRELAGGRASVLRAFAAAAGAAVLLQAALVAGAALRTAFLTPCSVGFGLPFVPVVALPSALAASALGVLAGFVGRGRARPVVGARPRRADCVPLGDAPRGLAGPGVVSPRSLPGHLAGTDLRRGPGAGPSSGPLPPGHPRVDRRHARRRRGRGVPAPNPSLPIPGRTRGGCGRAPRRRGAPARGRPVRRPRHAGRDGPDPGRPDHRDPLRSPTSPGRSPGPTPSGSSATARPTSPRWPPRWGSLLHPW